MKKLNIEKPGPFIKKSEFRAYLVKTIWNGGKTYKCDSINCPLADATGYAVDGSSYSHYPELLDISHFSSTLYKAVRTLPEWASNFVCNFDYACDEGHRKDANTALNVLDGKI